MDPAVFGVDVDRAQVTWSRLDPDVARLRAGDESVLVDPSARGVPGSAVVRGLPAGSLTEVVVEAADGSVRRRLPARTLSPPPGRELFRFATMSDLHLGERRFGFIGTMAEQPEPEIAYSIRAARAAVEELSAWGAQLLVVKGDVTVDSEGRDWDEFGALVAHAPCPVMATPGNHDLIQPPARIPWRRVFSGLPAPVHDEPVPVADGMRRAGFAGYEAVQVRDVPGLRIVLVDTTFEGHRSGRIVHATDEIVDAVATADGPAFVALHHQLMTAALPLSIPVGIRRDETTAFLDAAIAANPALFVTSGHTHRHRFRRYGPAAITEVGSPKDYPGTWAGYVVHEGGIRQVVHRIARPDVMAWTDRSAGAALGLWGRWSPGPLDGRCFSHTWPAR